jgi:hypothetical protein
MDKSRTMLADPSPLGVAEVTVVAMHIGRLGWLHGTLAEEDGVMAAVMRDNSRQYSLVMVAL